MSKHYTIFAEKKKCLTPIFRGGYINFFEPKELPQSEKLAWGMQLMIPKAGEGVAEWKKELSKIYGQVLVDKFGMEKAKELFKAIGAKSKFPVRDGDSPENAGLSNAEQLKGHWFINANNLYRPPYFIGPAGKKVDPTTLTSDDVYSGAHYRAMLEFWYYDKAGNQGISTTLAAIMKVKDDENLGAGTTTEEAESAFDDFSSEAVSVMDGIGDEETPKDPADLKVDDFDFI